MLLWPLPELLGGDGDRAGVGPGGGFGPHGESGPGRSMGHAGQKPPWSCSHSDCSPECMDGGPQAVSHRLHRAAGVWGASRLPNRMARQARADAAHGPEGSLGGDSCQRGPSTAGFHSACPLAVTQASAHSLPGRRGAWASCTGLSLALPQELSCPCLMDSEASGPGPRTPLR